MSENRKDLPAPSAPNFEQRLRETVMTYLGKQGDPLDRGLTVRDLVANGVLKLGAGWKGGSGLVPLVPGTALEVPTEEIDLTPPPTPTGFAVDSAISHVFIEHDAPLYRQGHGHKQTRVYGVNPTEDKPNPVFGDAIELGQFAGQVWAMPSNPSTTWHLWIKWETNDGVLSIDPAGGTNGLVVRTGEDVGLLLDALTGAITQGQLYQDLSNRIDLIDGNHPGSVNDRIQSAVLDESGARTLADTTLAAAVQQIFGDGLATRNALTVEQETRITETESLASQITTLVAQTGDNRAGLQVAQEAFADGSEALARQLTTLVAEAGANTAALMVEQEARADATSALASQVTSLASEVGSSSAALKVEQETRASETEAVARQVELLVAKTGDNIAAILETKDTLTTENSAVATAAAGLAVAAGNASAGILTTQQATADANGALAAQLASLAATTGANSAAITTDSKVKTDALTAMASEVKTLAVASGSNTAAIQAEAQVRADETGYLSGQYTVKVDIAGHVSGYGLASTGNTDAAFSEFGILADRFFISPPATSGITAPTTNLYPGMVWVDTSVLPSVTKYYTGSGWSTTPQALPFIVQTSPTKVDDIDIPAGVYMNAAYIKNGTITNAKIGKAAIDDAKIANLSASKITSGEIAVGREIKSTGFIANSGSTAGTGWRIGGNGNAEFNNATVRGTVYATNGQFWGTLLGGAATAFNSGLGFYAGGGSTGDGTNYRWRVGNPSGARIQWNGSAVEVYNASNTLAFSSGGIAWDSVTGKPIFGDLAAKDSLGYTEITGTKPPSDADKTSSNVAKGITNQGAFATLSKLTKYNVSTYIETAAITNAYIGNAEIDTLKLAGNAVTVPQIATSGDALTGDLTWKTVIETSITLDSSGTVMANFACKQGFLSYPNAWLFKMYIDSTVVFEVGGTSGIDSIAMVGAKSISVTSNSTKAVTIKVVWNSNNKVQVLNRSLWVMGAKR